MTTGKVAISHDPDRAELPGGGHAARRKWSAPSARVPGVTGVKLELTFDPPWTKDRMSEAAKLALGHRRHHSDREAATMKLSANEEYGLRCLVRIGYAGVGGRV